MLEMITSIRRCTLRVCAWLEFQKDQAACSRLGLRLARVLAGAAAGALCGVCGWLAANWLEARL